MAASGAQSPDEYLAGLEPERAAVLQAVRQLVDDHLPDGYVETMQYGMISWVVPLEVYPDTYNKQPAAYASLAAQKNYSSLYLMSVYSAAGRVSEEEMRARWAGGKKLDMGKSCVRFKAVDDLDLPLIGEIIGGTPVDAFVAALRAARG
jgi:hypothetical protein